MVSCDMHVCQHEVLSAANSAIYNFRKLLFDGLYHSGFAFLPRTFETLSSFCLRCLWVRATLCQECSNTLQCLSRLIDAVDNGSFCKEIGD
jgi:hypothetical protein